MKGVVSAGHELTAKAGVKMLEDGGNAFDAAVAAAFVSFVCESPLTSIGGGGFFMAHSGEGETLLYDFFPNVPGKGAAKCKDDIQFFPVEIDFTGTIQEFHIGKGSSAVPGCMAGLAEVFERHCTLPLKTLLAPAIEHARSGVVLNEQQAYFNSILSPILTYSDECRNIYAPDGHLLKVGERIIKREMSNTIEKMASDGLRSFYEGEIASKLLDSFAEDGLITEEDLKSYSVHIRKPLQIDYKGKKIYTNPPPSSGGCLIAFSLKLLESYDLAELGHNSDRYLELLNRVMRRTDEARGEDFDHKVYEGGLAESFLSDERVDLYLERLESGEEFGNSAEVVATGNTTHLSVIDGYGNAASITTSNGEGCGYMIPGTGVMMNNMLGEEDINPHGFHKQEPGIRMSSMMSPTVVMDALRPVAVLGSGGSNRIRNAILQVLLNLIDHKLPVHEAVNRPRVHWDGNTFQMEDGIKSQDVDALKETGIPLNSWKEKNMFFGGVHTVIMNNDGTVLSGAGDSRRGGVSLESIVR